MGPDISFPQNWVPPQELSGAIPRRKRLSKRGLFSVIFAVVMFAGAIFISLVMRMAGAQASEYNQRMRTEGRTASAQIIRLWHTAGKGSEDIVTYVFSAGPARVQGECQVPLRYWYGLRRGDSMAVRYLPSDPAVNHPAAWEEEGLPLWVAIVFPSLLGAIGVFLLITVQRQGQVAARGLATAGVVERCISVKTGWTIIYRYRTQDGAVMRGRDQALRPFDPGAQVCVLYLPGTARSSLYPLSLYRLG